jgi:hypothetical protein
VAQIHSYPSGALIAFRWPRMPLTVDIQVSPRFNKQQLAETVRETLAPHQHDDWRVMVFTPRPDSLALTVLKQNVAFHASLAGNPAATSAIQFLRTMLTAWITTTSPVQAE